MLAKICPERANHTYRVIFLFLSKIGFLSIILAPNMLEFSYDVRTYIYSTSKRKTAGAVSQWKIFGRNVYIHRSVTASFPSRIYASAGSESLKFIWKRWRAATVDNHQLVRNQKKVETHYRRVSS